MQAIRIVKVMKVAGPFILGCALIFAASSARAQDNVVPCSNHTLQGDYAFTIQGVLALPGGSLVNGGGIPLRGVVVQHYDGDGHFRQVDHLVVAGTPPVKPWTPGHGFYSVNADCTGSAVIFSTSSPTVPVRLHFVISREGKEIQQVVDANAVTALGTRVE